MNAFFAFCYGVTLLQVGLFLRAAELPDARTASFAAAVGLSYAGLYLLPAFLITRAVAAIVERHAGSSVLRGSLCATAVLTTAATHSFLFIDANLFKIYGFHVNGFVLNLVVTPGGLDSMGMSESTLLLAMAELAGLLGFQWGLWWCAHLWVTRAAKAGWVRHLPSFRTGVIAIVCLSIGERVAFGFGHFQAHWPTLAVANAVPFYLRLTFDRLAERLGAEDRSDSAVSLDPGRGLLAYPRAPLEIVPPARPMNVVWLVSESWRADALDPDIMPETWDFAQRAVAFQQHYSGGNGTRMGVFSMFYGLYGSYWFPVLDDQRGAVLMQALLAQGYQLSLQTSAHFTYPEFDKTVFADVPPESLHEFAEGAGWSRDRESVATMLKFIDGRDRSRPFMTFAFFESPHARYYFPPESVIREPYLEDFNYATMSLERDIELIRNRYLNSCRHLDSQFARVFEYLEQEGLLEDTIVIVTGDHGEEFLEKGRWGHGSTFVEEQVRVPLVIWLPGAAPRRVERMTSHLDLPATLLPRLGVRNDPADLSLGFDLFGDEVRRFTVLADWSRICVVDESIKAIFPMGGRSFLRNEVTTRDDTPLTEGDSRTLPVEELAAVLEGLSRFRRSASDGGAD